MTTEKKYKMVKTLHGSVTVLSWREKVNSLVLILNQFGHIVHSRRNNHRTKSSQSQEGYLISNTFQTYLWSLQVYFINPKSSFCNKLEVIIPFCRFVPSFVQVSLCNWSVLGCVIPIQSIDFVDNWNGIGLANQSLCQQFFHNQRTSDLSIS